MPRAGNARTTRRPSNRGRRLSRRRGPIVVTVIRARHRTRTERYKMADTKHTPGPWEASYGTDGYYQLTHDDGLELKENVEANCRVLAAAPDLLEVALLLEGTPDDPVLLAEIRKRGRAAIAKASITS